MAHRSCQCTCCMPVALRAWVHASWSSAGVVASGIRCAMASARGCNGMLLGRPFLVRASRYRTPLTIVCCRLTLNISDRRRPVNAAKTMRSPLSGFWQRMRSSSTSARVRKTMRSLRSGSSLILRCKGDASQPSHSSNASLVIRFRIARRRLIVAAFRCFQSFLSWVATSGAWCNWRCRR